MKMTIITSLVQSPTELTTSATDLVLAIECALIMVWLRHTPTAERWRTGLWGWVFGVLAFASSLGVLVHGLEMSNHIRAALWKPLFLSLGILVALFLVGAVADWRGHAVAKRFVPWSLGLGVAFFVLSQLLHGRFIIFIAYEALALLSALAIYMCLAAAHRRNGAAVIALAILLNLVAARVQASPVSVHILFPFDHNGAFHLVQMLSTAVLGLGVWLGMKPQLGASESARASGSERKCAGIKTRRSRIIARPLA